MQVSDLAKDDLVTLDDIGSLLWQQGYASVATDQGQLGDGAECLNATDGQLLRQVRAVREHPRNTGLPVEDYQVIWIDVGQKDRC